LELEGYSFPKKKGLVIPRQKEQGFPLKGGGFKKGPFGRRRKTLD